MPDLTFDPPLPTGDVNGLVQTIRLTAAGKPIAAARWHIVGDGKGGVAQILDLATAPAHRRTGQGKRLLAAMLEQIQKFFRTRQIAPRRIWITIEQKDQVIGRAFLTHAGFHLVATIPSLLQKQDAMIYVLSLD